MSPKFPFTIRVYGIMVLDRRLLVCDEHHRGRDITKFPGGGLEFGEGTVDCLKREMKEELDLDVEVKDHFYTTDFFQRSAFDNDIQVVSVYYIMRPPYDAVIPVSEKKFDYPVKEEKALSFRWIEASVADQNVFSFPIDRKVAGLIVQCLV